MLDDLISRQAAIDAAVKMFEAWYGCSFLREREIRARFYALPSVDAVPVVRCKDCARFDKKRGCNLVDGLNIAKTNSFCSYGERKGR